MPERPQALQLVNNTDHIHSSTNMLVTETDFNMLSLQARLDLKSSHSVQKGRYCNHIFNTSCNINISLQYFYFMLPILSLTYIIL